jgi:quercetin dioxygenase-like cupin family protein
MAMNETDFRAELTAAGYTGPELVAHDGDLFNAEHTHDFAVHLLILDGEITVAAAGETTTCRAGDTFKLAGGVPHTEQYGPDGARVLVGRRFP